MAAGAEEMRRRWLARRSAASSRPSRTRQRATGSKSGMGPAAPPFLIVHGLADSSVPHQQSVRLYEVLARAGAEAELRSIDGLPHTFYNRTNLDELAGPFRMEVRTRPRGGSERTGVDRAGVFDVARAFFERHLR